MDSLRDSSPARQLRGLGVYIDSTATDSCLSQPKLLYSAREIKSVNFFQTIMTQGINTINMAHRLGQICFRRADEQMIIIAH
jgi:hypothetical protein